jgi:uncharacterized protein (UPF0254 family)
MDSKKTEVPAQAGGARGGPGNRTPAISVDYYDVVWHVIDKVAKVVPMFTITLRARQEVKIEIEGSTAEIGCNGITLRSSNRKVDMDPRYNAAAELYNNKVVVSDRVEYRGAVYEVFEFVELFKKRVRELIEEIIAAAGL